MRGTYGAPLAHDGAVVGVACDGMNTRAVSAGVDGVVRVWSFIDGTLLGDATLPCAAVRVELHRASALLAVVCADFRVVICDVETVRIVRTFSGHVGRVTGVAWSPDARWLVTAAMDTTVRVFDVPAGCLLSWFAVERAATSVAFSPR